jgi:hypothetical protein
MTNKCEIKGVILASSLTVLNGYIMTSVLNTNDTKMELQEPLVQLDEVDLAWDRR